MLRDASWRLPRVASALLVALNLLLAAGGHAAAEERNYCGFGERTSVFIVDQATRFDPADEKALIEYLESFYAAQTAGERVLVVAIGGAAADLKVVFDECRPGCPTGAMLERLLSACRPIAALSDLRQFERRFIAASTGALRDFREEPTSDLFRSIADTSRIVVERRYKSLRQMLVYSNLLEASPLLPAAVIRRLPPGETLYRLRMERVEARLAGANVRILGFGREDGPRGDPLPEDLRRKTEEVWRQWLLEGDARDVQIIPR